MEITRIFVRLPSKQTWQTQGHRPLGDAALLIAGLASSIPLVVFAGNPLAGMMERIPVLANAGAADYYR
jgi:hypothetical protein